MSHKQEVALVQVETVELTEVDVPAKAALDDTVYYCPCRVSQCILGMRAERAGVRLMAQRFSDIVFHVSRTLNCSADISKGVVYKAELRS